VPEPRDVEVAIVGGGPSGAALATRLAQAGREVALFERWPEPRWRPCGVYTSPQTRRALLDLGLAPTTAHALLQPVSELVVETVGGARCTLVHGANGPAAGVDRVRLERALLNRAATVGAAIQEGAVVRGVEWGTRARDRHELSVSVGGSSMRWTAHLIVGADGPRSLVARAAGVTSARTIARAGLTVHRAFGVPTADRAPTAARLVFGPGWYLGATPVPGGRVNLGLVLTAGEFRRRLARGSDEIIRSLEQQLPRANGSFGQHLPRTDGSLAWSAANADAVQLSYPLAHRVRRLAGPGFLLVGDAAGFIDPVSGEGIYRAFQTAEHAAEAIGGWHRGEKSALDRYDGTLRSRFRRKDAISWLLQLLMSRPALLDYAVRRLDRRAAVRGTFGLVMSDLAPPERALNARFLAALLAP
jgi:flavin-dependent dehydrogenase